MSAESKAVFLSYASQDAEAVLRIAEALRAAGVEVWFDQDELVGGDAWDAKIRGQISSCALFVPLISANTQARLEGYFRLEWKLAAQRTHTMADEKAFLLPILLDGTRDAEAKVPAEFKAVQWTKLPGGETPPAFAARVKKLLGGTVAGVVDPVSAPGSTSPATARRTPPGAKFKIWLVAVIITVAVAAGIWQQRRDREKLPVSAPVAVVSASSAELARVRARVIPDRWQREDFAVVSAMLDRLIQANPEEADAWALRSIINSLQVVRNFDAGTKSLEAGKSDADRALRLAPGSPLAEIAFGIHLVAMTSRGGDASACRPYIDRGVAALPPDALTRYAKLVSHWFGYEFETVQRVALEWLEAEPQASFPAWILSQSFIVQRQPDEAEKWAERALVDSGITGVRAYYTLFESKYYLRADVRAAREALDRIPATGRSVHRVVHARWLLAMAGQKWDEALQELSRVPEPFLFDRSYHGPKALLAGFAHQRAGRPEAAVAQFREAERLLRERLAADPDNEELHGVLAVTLACTGRVAEARSELALVEPLVKGRAPTLQRGSLALPIAQAYAILRDPAGVASWLRLLLAEPSQFPFTPAAIRLDPRFAVAIETPEIQALLKEFATLDQSAAAAVKADDKSVAVLPFANLSDDKDSGYFADGVQEDILTNLSNLRELRVISRTSVMNYRDSKKSLRQIAQELGVGYVLEGSVRRAGGKVRITSQLIRAATDEPLWAKNYDRDLTDIFAIQSELAQAIAGELKVAISPQEKNLLGRRPTENLAAYDLYLKADEIVQREGVTPAAYQKAESLLQSAVELDPRFVKAWSRLSSYQSLAYFVGFNHTAAQIAKAKGSLDAVLRLAPDSPEALWTAGSYYHRTREFARALGYFDRLAALQPNSASLANIRALILFGQGKVAESLDEYRRALQLEPPTPGRVENYKNALVAVRRYDEAAALQRQLVALRANAPQERAQLAHLSFLATGSRREMETLVASLSPAEANSPRWIDLRRAYASSEGDWAEAVRLDRLQPYFDGDGVEHWQQAVPAAAILAAQGDQAGARARLENLPAEIRARLELEPKDESLWLGLAYMEWLLGRPVEALRCARRAVELVPASLDAVNSTGPHYVLALTSLANGDQERALALLEQLLRTPGGLNVHELRTYAEWNSLRGDPRFEALLNDPKNNAPLF